MKAAIFKEKGKIRVEDVPKPSINENECLIKVKYCSICGTDKKIYNNGHSNIGDEGQILGHEITGTIVEKGEKVKHYKNGMRVVLAPNVGCGYCKMCREGKEQLCENYEAFGIGRPGGFAEFVKIPEEAIKRGHLVVLPDEIDFESASLIEPLSCCYNGRETMDIRPGENVLIFGAGSMGSLHLLLNQSLGASNVFMVDIDERKLEYSKKIGADKVILSEEVEDKVYELTNGQGVDNIITAAPAAAVQEAALNIVAKTGNINFFAGIAGENPTLEINPNKLHYEQIRITGTTGSSLEQFRRTVNILKNNNLNLHKIITNKISIDELSSIFEKEDFLNKNLKILVDPKL